LFCRIVFDDFESTHDVIFKNETRTSTHPIDNLSSGVKQCSVDLSGTKSKNSWTGTHFLAHDGIYYLRFFVLMVSAYVHQEKNAGECFFYIM